jgi:hypothetical protein
MSAHHLRSYRAVIAKVRRAGENLADRHGRRSAMSDTSAGHPHRPGRYEIRIRGHLATRWATWFDGMTLTAERDGTTVLEGPVVDQAALHGLLHKVRDTGLPLLSVTQLDVCPPATSDHAHPGD